LSVPVLLAVRSNITTYRATGTDLNVRHKCHDKRKEETDPHYDSVSCPLGEDGLVAAAAAHLAEWTAEMMWFWDGAVQSRFPGLAKNYIHIIYTSSLDLGCGTGISSRLLSRGSLGHHLFQVLSSGLDLI
jgi:hypothetical protein